MKDIEIKEGRAGECCALNQRIMDILNDGRYSVLITKEDDGNVWYYLAVVALKPDKHHSVTFANSKYGRNAYEALLDGH